MHKFVLIVHSAVFQAMFAHKESAENVQSRMKIADFNPKIVGQMLEYLYSAELPNKLSGQNLFELLKIAEKYDLKMLKSVSEEKMILRFYCKNDKIKKFNCNKS